MQRNRQLTAAELEDAVLDASEGGIARVDIREVLLCLEKVGARVIPPSRTFDERSDGDAMDAARYAIHACSPTCW